MEGTGVPFFVKSQSAMIQKDTINQSIETFLSNTDYYLVDTIISADNRIMIEIDAFDGVEIDFCAEFSKRDSFHLAITPEGTRSLAPKWKMGFYHIAVTANVPIQLAYLDYKKAEFHYQK